MHIEQYELHANVEDRHWWFRARRTIMQSLVREILPPSAKTVVVDIGCGTGGNIAALADQYRCVGFDTSRDAVALARRKSPGVQFIGARDREDLNDILPRAGLVTLMDVLEHVPDDFSLLSELVAMTSPGAMFLVTVPAEMDLWSVHDESFGHYRRYDAARLARLWTDLPVVPRLLSHFNTRLYPIVRMLRRKNRRRGRASGDYGTDLRVPMAPVNWMLEKIFAGERHALVDLLRGHRDRPLAYGVSLVALLQRIEGDAAIHMRPADVAADPYDPIRGEWV